MKKKTLLITALALSIITGCSNTPAAVTMDIPELLTPVDAPVHTACVTRGDLLISEYSTATVVPYVEEYAFRTAGIVDTVHFNIGDEVHEGDLIIELDHTEADNAIIALNNEIELQKASYEADNETYTLLLTSLRQQKEDLISGKTKVTDTSARIKLIDCDIAIYEAKLRQNSEKLEIELRELNEEIAKLKEDYEKHFIYAPIDGHIIYKAEKKVFLEADSTAIAIADYSQKYIRTDNSVDYYAAKAIGLHATFAGQSYDLTYVPFTAYKTNKHVIRQNKATNFTSDEVFLNSLEYGDELLVTIDVEIIEDVLLIPNTAIYCNPASYEPWYVYVMNEDGTRTRRYISAGQTNNLYTIITGGLEEGEIVLEEGENAYVAFD